MKQKAQDILRYLYRQRQENNINSVSLVELPNTDGVNELYSNGYINAAFDKNRSIKSLSITGKGIDWIKASGTPPPTIKIDVDNVVMGIKTSTPAIVDNDIIKIKIRPEIYGHLKQGKYLENKDYFHAVDEAYKVVRKKLEDITGEEAATNVFNMNAESKKYYTPLFNKSDGADKAEKDFFRGVGYLHLGVQFLRNEKAHALATTVDPNLAVHYISLASLAYDLISRGDSESRDS